MRHSFSATVLACSLSAAAPSAADPSPRFFAGVGAGYATSDGRASTDVDPPTFPQTSLPIDGMPLGGEDVAWRVFAGWAPSEHWSLELGYADLGRFRSDRLLVGGLGFVMDSGQRVGLSSTAWSLGASFRRPVAERWYGSLGAAVLRAEFEADGRLTFPGVPFSTVPPVSLPFATPDDETGWAWNFAVGRQFSSRWSAELAYRQYELQVIEVETVSLELRLQL
jgi:hypothetical protein